MCVAKDNLLNSQKEMKQQNNNNQNWSQIFRKPLKPKLPRKIVSSAKLNINRYWHKFEELLNNSTNDHENGNSYFSADNNELICDNNSNSVNNEENIDGGNNTMSRTTRTRTSFRLLPPQVNFRKRLNTMTTLNNNNNNNNNQQQKQPKLIPQNNIHDEITSFMAKKFTIEKNHARTSKYKHFNDESLYHGVNLNVPATISTTTTTTTATSTPTKRCSCSLFIDPNELIMLSTMDDDTASLKYQFNHRNFQLTYEDKENLENEAMEVYSNLGYRIRF